MDIIRDFLESELSSIELYEEIVEFIISPHVRSGEFEGNSYIIKKMDQTNYIIYLEDVYPDGRRNIVCAKAEYRKSLLKKIYKNAFEKKFIFEIPEDESAY